MFIPHREVWKRQPQVAVGIDVGNEFAPYLASYMLPLGKRGFVSHGMTTIDNSWINNRLSKEGLGYCPTVASGIGWHLNIPNKKAPSECSLLVWAVPDSTSTTDGAIVAARYSSVDQLRVGIGNGTAQIPYISGYQYTRLEGTPISSSEVIVGVYRQNAEQSLYQNGVLTAQSSVSGGQGVIDAGFFLSAFYPQWVAGTCVVVLAFYKAFTPGQVKRLSANPWQLFAP